MNTSAAQIAQVAQLTNPGERTVNGFIADELPVEHNLSSCAAEFCDGDLSHYLDLYYLVFHAPTEQLITRKKRFQLGVGGSRLYSRAYGRLYSTESQPATPKAAV